MKIRLSKKEIEILKNFSISYKQIEKNIFDISLSTNQRKLILQIIAKDQRLSANAKSLRFLQSFFVVSKEDYQLIQTIKNNTVLKRKLHKNSLKKNNKKSTLEDDKIYINLLEEISKLGLPFYKHRNGSEVYSTSMKYIKKYYKKYRVSMIDAFELAKEYFTNPDFIYKPKKISITDFFKYTDSTLQANPYLKKINVKSWFFEFMKGKEHIENNFMIVKTDQNPDLTKFIIDQWKLYRRKDEVSIYEKRMFQVFSEKIKKYSIINNIMSRSIMDAIAKEYFIKKDLSPGFFNSNYFFKNELSNLLIKVGIVKSKKELKN